VKELDCQKKWKALSLAFYVARFLGVEMGGLEKRSRAEEGMEGSFIQ
jgi:hypothetical protein